MCPAHLTYKWKNEVERNVPNGKGYIIHNLKELLSLDNKIKNKEKKENMYLIIGKESAKFNYETCPAALWSISKNAFVCPSCGQILQKSHYEGEGRLRHIVYENLEEFDFTKPNRFNTVCLNTIKKWNNKIHDYEEIQCNTKLWKPSVKEDLSQSEWIKVGKEGWLLKRHIKSLYDKYTDNIERLTKKERELYVKLYEKLDELNKTGDVKGLNRAPRKYSLSQYVKKYYSNNIDYFIADEIQVLLSDSEQGHAFTDFNKVAKKTVCLTGTLLNGYASSLFYMLYRTMPYLMQKEKFSYNSLMNFTQTYGVYKVVETVSAISGRNSTITKKKKQLPGVSPLLFSKLLLEHTVFVSLSDMSNNLPNYTEYPIGIDLSEDVKNAYDNFTEQINNLLGQNSFSMNGKIMTQILQSLSIFPDMPYEQPPIMNFDTGETLIIPPNIENPIQNKINETIRIVQEKVSKGEKVLIYYHWTKRTDIAQQIKNILKQLHINSSIMNSDIKPEERELWIEDKIKKGMQVLICNPTLVETGLDLLDFTTIIFCQLGLNIFTMRQASRRSWRLGQTHPVEVYFLYYKDTIQEQSLSLMANKLHASLAIEGKFSEEGLRAMNNNEDLLTQIASSIVNGIKYTVQSDSFCSINNQLSKYEKEEIRERKPLELIGYHQKILSYLNYYRTSYSKGEKISKPYNNLMYNQNKLIKSFL